MCWLISSLVDWFIELVNPMQHEYIEGGEGMIGSLAKGSIYVRYGPHEARDFTPWLEENIDVLNNAIDLSLSDRGA